MKKIIVYFTFLISIIACTNIEPEYSDLPRNWFKTGWYEYQLLDSSHFNPEIDLSSVDYKFRSFYNEDSSRVYIENDSLYIKKICITKDVLLFDSTSKVIFLKCKITNKKIISNNKYIFDFESITFPYDFSYDKSIKYQEGKFTGQMIVFVLGKFGGNKEYYVIDITGKLIKKNNEVIDNIHFSFINGLLL